MGLNILAQAEFSNPVLNMRDGCIERWRGYYYALGGETAGNIYQSSDMVTWGNPTLGVTTTGATWLNDPQWTQASTYKRVDAGDILFRNGVFHVYFNGVGHCYAQEPMGPYKEATLNVPFDDYGIDVQIFQDEDGQAYYTKKRNAADPHPTTGAVSNISGPEVWSFAINNLFDRKSATKGRMQMSHQPGHPTSLNHSNFEGPEMARYRDRYYIFYAVNRMGPRSGMYEIGCAESSSPMTFNNTSKYPHPVICRNTEDQLLRYHAIAPTAEHGGWDATYTLTTPPTEWTNIDFDDSSWEKSMGGFGFQEYDLYSGKTFTNARIRARKTFWKTSRIYIRRTFNIEELPNNAELKIWVNGIAKVYINGKLFNTYKMSHNTYSAIVLNPSILRVGKNVVAVDMNSTNQTDTSQQLIDFGIYDTGQEKPEEIMINPAQPNFIAGPNGFEQWMMYKAFIDGVEKNSVDRVHFYGHEAVCEATVKSTTGYRPAPAQPTFINYLDNTIYHPFEFLDGSNWAVRNKVLIPQSANGGSLIIRKDDECNYRFEVPFCLGKEEDRMGVYACYEDKDNWVKVEMGRSGKWTLTDCSQGTLSSTDYELPARYAFLDPNELVKDFKPPWHTLTIYKNDEHLSVWVDNFNLTHNGSIPIHHLKGRIGLWASSATVSFDAIQYTNGWDEYDNKIYGWTLAGQEGSLRTSNDGLILVSEEESKEVFATKGDAQWNYEFSTYMQHSKLPQNGRSGFFPLWVDSNNYVKAVVDYADGTLHVEARELGLKTFSEKYPLSRKQMRQYAFTASSAYPTNNFTYNLRSESQVSGIDILWLEDLYPYLKQTFDLPNKVTLYAKVGTGWTKLDATLNGTAELGKISTYTFPAVTTSALKISVIPPTGKASRAFCTYVHEDISANYYIRCRRDDDGVHIIINDEQKCLVTGQWDKSVVALTTEGMETTFNGNLHYQTGGIRVTSISIEADNCEIGCSTKLRATIMPHNATNKHLVWVSSNPNVAVVDQDGRMTRLADGEVTITAYTADGGTKAGKVVIDDLRELGVSVPSHSETTQLYDLLGRRAKSISKDGIYIWKGHKTMFSR